MLQLVYTTMFLMLVIPDAYIYFVYVRKWTGDWKWRLLSFLPSLLLVIYFIVVLANDDMRASHQPMVCMFATIFYLITIPKTVFAIFDSIGFTTKCLMRRSEAKVAQAVKQEDGKDEEPDTEIPARSEKTHRYIRLFAMALAICSIYIVIYGYIWGRSNFKVNQHTVEFKNLPPEFDGYRILHFSDLHLGTFDDGHRDYVTTIANLINSQKCDLVLFTGDIVNYESGELLGYKEVLSSIKAPDGVYSVLGNHDYEMYFKFPEDKSKYNEYEVNHYLYLDEKERDADVEVIKSKQKEYGWNLLLNQNSIIRRGNDSIAIIGTENHGKSDRFPRRADLPKATKGLYNIMKDSIDTDGINKDSESMLPPHTFSILLTHDPTYWRMAVLSRTNIDLTLAGHTHAGQFKIFGWSPVSFNYDEWSGFYDQGEQILNVNDGLGENIFPFRFGAWPEIDVITLKRGE